MLRNKIFYNSSNTFFTPKKIMLISFSFLIFILALAIVFWKMKINIADLFITIDKSYHYNNIASLYIILILLFPLTKALYIFSYVYPQVKSSGVYISKIEYFFLFTKVLVINGITPFSTGSEPYTIYWLTSRGVDIKTANTITVTNGFLVTITEILITIPSFVYISTHYQTLVATSSGLVVYWFIVGGLLVNVCVAIFLIIVSFSTKIHFKISMLFNLVLKKLKLPHLNKNEIVIKYMVEESFKKEFKKSFKKKRMVLFVVATYTFMTLYYYNTLYMSFLVSYPYNNVLGGTYNYFMFFNIANVSLTANAFIPIPGGEGTVQVANAELLKIFVGHEFVNNQLINNSISIWRIGTNYIPIAWCFILTVGYYLLKLFFMKTDSPVVKNFKIT